MEKALRYELKSRIPELAPFVDGKGTTVTPIFATHAPEKLDRPYLVYVRTNTDKDKTFEGYTQDEGISYMFSCMAVKYEDMKSLSDKVEAFLTSIIMQNIGEQIIYVKNLTINSESETWENELGVNRGIINFTIYH